MFWNGKRAQNEALRKIAEMKAQELEEKTMQRNRVRMMEIESKENIVSSWNKRLGQMRQSRQNLLAKKDQEKQQNSMLMSQMSKKERKMLK